MEDIPTARKFVDRKKKKHKIGRMKFVKGVSLMMGCLCVTKGLLGILLRSERKIHRSPLKVVVIRKGRRLSVHLVTLICALHPGTSTRVLHNMLVFGDLAQIRGPWVLVPRNAELEKGWSFGRDGPGSVSSRE